jgi:hypothetical protein
MATTQVNQKVFVSPGVYTSETDLTFVAQSVGVTTLGLVGETLRGPAFEPIFITNYDEFQAFFGGTEPTKFVNTQIPKYEAAYIAKSYLQQSNQLFVTRVLGLSGYDAGPSWSIRLNANVDGTTVGISNNNSWTADFEIDSRFYYWRFTTTPVPQQILDNLDVPYRLFDGSVSTLRDDFHNIVLDICVNSTGSTLTPASATTAVFYGSIDSTDYNNVISTYTNPINVYGVDAVSIDDNDLESSVNDPWFYANFENNNTDNYSGYSFYYTVSNITEISSGGQNYGFSGTVSGNFYNFTGFSYSDYNNQVIATIRSRGISLYNSTNHGPTYEVPGRVDSFGNFVGDDLQLVCTGEYSNVNQSPYATFLLSGYTKDNVQFSFETNLQASSTKYITKVLGTDNFGKSRSQVPIFVEEIYPGLLDYLYNNGYIKGLNCELVALPDARSRSTQSIAWNLEKYTTPVTPYLVSELRGTEVFRLFRFVSISDGTAANTEIKVSIAGISFNNLTFDVLVRSFFDTDTNPVVIEKFTNCNLDINSNNFIAKKIGSVNGEFQLISKYIMVEMAEEYPSDALPCGFYGYTQRQYSNLDNKPPIPVYKTQYNFPGQTIFDPPFGSTSGGDNVVSSSGDNVRRTYLGFSSRVGVDDSFLQYKGKQNPVTNWATATESNDWNYFTKGFHMDSGATSILISTSYTTSGTPAFETGVASFTSDPSSQDNPYYFIYARKFTVCFAGGFDGWDVYREYRTNEDRFRLGGTGYLAGSAPSARYPLATGDGMFKPIVVNQNTVDWANTDYYAYLLGIDTFANPESTNINVFATTGIDYVNHSNLVEEAISMVQFDRADSIYIATTPDYDMFTPDGGDSTNNILPTEAVDNLDQTGIDSNYTATYYPWILVRDTVNNTQIYLPPTGEVCRNLALTDNIAFPWFASAGYTRGLVNSVKARFKLTQEDRDILYQGRINPIATFSDVGTVIWGNKTLQVADSALNRLNVRRLLLQARKLISAVAVRLLFEQNDQIVRQQFLDSVNPILDAIRRDRGLYDFRVTVSSSPEDLDRNTLNGKIYLKPTRALEFINIEFLITPTGASFENI